MKFEKKYTLEKWTEWNSFLDSSVDNFVQSFSLYPNIMEANRHTHSQIDFLINNIPGERDKVHRKNEITDEEIKPDYDEVIEITSFTTETYAIDFAIDDNMIDREIRLVYDSEPDWGHETNSLIPVETDEILISTH